MQYFLKQDYLVEAKTPITKEQAIKWFGDKEFHATFLESEGIPESDWGIDLSNGDPQGTSGLLDEFGNPITEMPKDRQLAIIVMGQTAFFGEIVDNELRLINGTVIKNLGPLSSHIYTFLDTDFVSATAWTVDDIDDQCINVDEIGGVKINQKGRVLEWETESAFDSSYEGVRLSIEINTESPAMSPTMGFWLSSVDAAKSAISELAKLLKR